MGRDLYVCLGPIDGSQRCPDLSDQRRCPRHRTRQARGLDAEYDRNRPLVLARDGYRCRYCGGPAATADHVRPRSEGGTSSMSNLVAACGTCNRAKGGAGQISAG